MAHHSTHGGYARAAQRRGEDYVMCAVCGQRSHRYLIQAFEEKPETFSDFVKAMAVAVLLVVALYVAVLMVAAYGMGS